MLKRQAVELRDGGKAYMGKGVRKAVGFVNTEIAKAIAGMDPTQQVRILEFI
jgi:enolase